MPVARSADSISFESAQASLGHDAAEALMELLPTDPEQMATKADLHELHLAGRTDFAELRVEMHRAFAEQTRTLLLAMIGFVLSASAVAFAAVRVAG